MAKKIVRDDSSDKILQAALKVLEEKTISGARMRHIAEECQMSQGIVYYHFKSKKDLLTKMLDYILNCFKTERVEDFEINESVEGNFHAFFEEKKRSIRGKQLEIIQFDFWVQAHTDPEVKQKVSTAYDNWRDSIQKVLEEGVKEGLFQEDRIEHSASQIISFLMGTAMQYMVYEDLFDLDDYMDKSEKRFFNYLQGK